MARRRFFVPEIRRGMAELTGPDAEHLVRVLRAEAGCERDGYARTALPRNDPARGRLSALPSC